MSEIRRRASGPARDFGADVHPILQRVYAARGLTCRADLDLSLERLLPVSSLAGVEEAAALLARHRGAGRVLVIGDFDADGATGSALLVRGLRRMRFAHVDFLVPNRFRFGYGLTPEIVALAAERRPSLIVTVDNGITSIEGVEAARALGVPVLITDHHLPGAALPRAQVIVNPNLPGATFGSPALAGVGVAFYVIAALARLLEEGDFRPAELLDLVALGTVADVVPLDRNNRILVAQGLRRIRAGRCAPGIRALLESGGRRLEEASAADLGFGAAPRLNAAGRLSDMSLGIACLLEEDPRRAAESALKLAKLNEERRSIEQRMQAEAVELAAAVPLDAEGSEALGLCLFDATWHPGVVGLVAGRIKERLHRPVIAFARADAAMLRGSARSVAGVNIRDVIDEVATRHPGLIDKFGGHAMAAGLSLKAQNLERFRSAFAEAVALRADAQSLRGVIHTDGELCQAQRTVETARLLRGGGPWGQGFPEPVFDGGFQIAETRVVGGKHLKLKLLDGASAQDAILFGYLGGAGEELALNRGTRVHIAYRLELNAYGGAERVQLNCEHLALAAGGGSDPAC